MPPKDRGKGVAYWERIEHTDYRITNAGQKRGKNTSARPDGQRLPGKQLGKQPPGLKHKAARRIKKGPVRFFIFDFP